MRRTTVVAAAAVWLSVMACGGGNSTPSPVADALAACAALRASQVPASAIGLPTRGAVVTSATFVPSSPTNASGEYCLVNGQIASVDVTAQPITFALALPTFWNGRALQQGGGGWDGGVPDPTGTATASVPPPPPLAKGYAVFGSDGGHSGGDASFAVNAEQLQNFAGDHLKKTRDTVVEFIKARYRAAPSTTYFVGQSGGGREAFAAMQRWGVDYDGIVAIFPGLDYVPAFLKTQHVGTTMRVNGGAGWFNLAKATVLRNAVLHACDALDGVADGVISNYNACTFDPRTIRCPGGADTGDTCFSDQQLASLTLLETATDLPYTLANGVNQLPAFNRGADWSGAIAGTDLPLGSTAAFNVPAGGGTPARSEIGWDHWFGDGLVRYALYRDPHADALPFDPVHPGPLLPRLQRVSALLDVNNPDIRNFLNNGGKLILVHGQADQLLPTQPTIDYYHAVVSKFGQAAVDRSVRFYLIPGYSHFGGVSFNATQGMSVFPALEEWVEKDIAPGTLVVTDTNAGAQNRTRPMCVYHAWPKYHGTGDVNLASSFSCVSG